MAARTHLKLGVFTLVTVLALVVAGFALGARSLNEELSLRHMYFDESVEGLEVGSPVKYRGVNIGAVSRIEIAPDLRHVHVITALNVGDLRRVGLLGPRARAAELAFPEDVRAQLGTQGITGVKFVNLDLLGAEKEVPSLPFELPEGTIAVAPSLFKTLADNAATVVEDLSAISQKTVASLEQVERFTTDLNGQALPAGAKKVLDVANRVLVDVQRITKDVDNAQLPEKLATLLASLDKSTQKLHALLERIDGGKGLLSSTQRATDAVGDLGQSYVGSADDVERTLRDIGETAQAIKDLSLTLERDPDMLLKGGTPTRDP